MSKIVILQGSPTAKSRLNGVLDRVRSQIEESGAEVSVINVRDLPAEDLLHARFDSQAIAEANALVAAADAVVIASPVYKASFTGILKAYLDLLPQKGLENKIVLPLVVGGTIAHLLAIDYAFKPVLSVLGARNILTGVFVLDTQVTWGEDGKALIEEDIAGRIDAATSLLVQEARWQTERSQG
ncbi:NADPH-dependent FMN reductase [Cohnella sp. GbtcB17]|uniref:NADPH-dependent FMN reductase n=1 Tax=Cohnella sp. GbtcB17 TaxID=2824762 RepID=UPI001C2FEB49|nr:NADPH-dependent FMN reductase [Cohnella sp. GbtcB17]